MTADRAADPGVLLTRPAGQSEALAKTLRNLGYAPFIDPLLNIIPISKQLDSSGIQALLFTSANAVGPFCAANAERDLPVFAVGAASAAALRKAGFREIHTGDSGADAVARDIIRLCDPQNGSVLHVSGETIRGNPAGILDEGGFDYRREIVYRADAATEISPKTMAAIKDDKITTILFFSPRTGETFANLIGMAGLTEKCGGMMALCLSPAVAGSVRNLPWRTVIAAKSPQTDAMIAALKDAIPVSRGS